MSSAPESTVKPGKPASSSQGTGKLILKNAKAPSEDTSASSKVGGEAHARSEARTEESKSSDKKTMTKPPSMRRQQSDIFKSFSKPKATLKREDTGSSTDASPAGSAAPALNKVRFKS